MATTAKYVLKSLTAATIITTLFSCGSNQENVENTVDSSATTTEAPKPQTNKPNVFYSIPSPIQLGQLLQRAGAKYDKGMLNATENVSKYSTAASRALNLGVYGTDMSYSAIFNMNQECMAFLDCSKKLADQLGSSGAFAKETIDRLKKNNGDRDSMLAIISEIFLSSNELFKENEQGNTGVLALAGGFIEGLYVGTQVAATLKDNSQIVTRIAELKGSLNNMVALLETQSSDAEVASVLNDIKEIKAVYDQMKMEDSKPKVTSDSTKNTITIGGGSKYMLSKEQLDSITAKAKALRAKITQS